MAAHLLIASSNGKTCGCLASFMQDAERSLAALYYCVREIYDERAARSAAESWLQILEERLEGPSDLPELTRITAAAIALFVSTIANRPLASSFKFTSECTLKIRNFKERYEHDVQSNRSLKTGTVLGSKQAGS